MKRTGVCVPDRSRGGLGLVVASLLLCGGVSAGGPPPGWLPELGEGFEQYFAGRYRAAQDAADRIARAAHEPRLRDEARALWAMAAIRLPSRDERLDGRQVLRTLAEHNPALTRRPEVRLALGIAQTALFETASAIQELTAAADAFEQQGRTDRALEALVALARAWAVHGEWEIALPGLVASVPADRAGRERLRQTMIGHVRERAAKLPHSADAVARIELILADRLLASEATRRDGLRRLERLTQSLELTPAVADACLKLAAIAEQQRRWETAARLLDRVRASALPQADEAQRRYASLTEPQIELEAPATVRPGQPLSLSLRARNVIELRLELRRVDLPEVLRDGRGQIVPARLPEAGSRVATARFRAPEHVGRSWWEPTVRPTHDWRPPAGSYALIARALGPGGLTRVHKRLLLVSALDAAVLVGARRAVVCAHWADGDFDLHAPPTAEFWVAGAFVPRTLTLADPVAAFELPGDLRVLGARRWVCLVRSGEHAALVRAATTPAQRSRARPDRAALTGWPPVAQAGQPWHVLGVLLDAPDPAPAASPLRVELVDAQDRTVAAAVAEERGGTFVAEPWIPRDFNDRTLRVRLWRGERAIVLDRSPRLVPVQAADAPPWTVELHTADHLPAEARSLPGRIVARQPWGAPITAAASHVTIQPVALPDGRRLRPVVAGPTSVDEGHTDARGAYEFALPVGKLCSRDPPVVLNIRGGVTGWDGRHVDEDAAVLIGPRPPVVWIELPQQPVRVGDPVRFTVGWCDPGVTLPIETARLLVRTPDGRPHMLALEPAGVALRSRVWRPPVEGSYRIEARVDQAEEPLAVARFDVQPSSLSAGGVERLEARRSADGRFVCVTLAVRGSGEGVVLVADREPVAAIPTRFGPEPARFEIPLPDRTGPMASVVVTRWTSAGLSVLATELIQPAQSVNPRVQVPPAAAAGTTIPVRVDAAGLPPDATLIVRLGRVGDALSGSTVPAESRAIGSAGPVLGVQDSQNQGAEPRTVVIGRLPAPWQNLLYRGSAWWIERVEPLRGGQTLRVPLPELPARWRLSVYAVVGSAIVGRAAAQIDTRTVPRAALWAPRQWTEGDRVHLTLAVTNPTSHPVTRTLRLAPGRRLTVEPTELAEKGRTLHLDPGQTVRVPLTLEATRAGRGRIRWWLIGPDQRASWSRSVRVRPSPEPVMEPRPLVRIDRRVYRIRENPADEVRTDVQPQDRVPWTRELLRPNDRVIPGTRLLISDRWTVAQSLRDVRVVQSVAPNCMTVRLESNERPGRVVFAEPALRTLDALEWRIEHLQAGQHVHEFVIVAVTGGVATLPPPRLTAAGRPVNVAADPPAWPLRIR